MAISSTRGLLIPRDKQRKVKYKSHMDLIFPQFFRTYGYSAKGWGYYYFWVLYSFSSNRDGKVVRELYSRVRSSYEYMR